MADPSVRARLIELGAEPVISTPEELAKFMRAETEKWHDIIVKAGVPVGQL
jgi:tripartite-type tricarboxylate transporter receptor subunit TctC